MTGFPIGAVLGPFAATHRGMISAITPIAIPQGAGAPISILPSFTASCAARSPCSSSTPPPIRATAEARSTTLRRGDVLGIVNMVFVKGTKESALTQPSGITYAMPARYLQDLLSRNATEAAAQK